jgi:hypothetical protein
MGDFSVERALGAGFSVIKRRPLALLAWAAAYFVVGLLPTSFVWAKTMPALLAQAAQPAADPQAIAALSGMSGWTPVLWLLGLVVASVLYGAVYRAVLEPEDDKYFYLRLSSRELWLGLTMLALVVVFCIGLGILVVALTIVARTAPGIVSFVAIIAAIVGVIWLVLRMSLSTPMAFAERRFIFADAWQLTERHALKLFGVAVALVVIIIMMELVILVPIGLAFGLSGAWRQVMNADPAHFIAQGGPWLLLGGVLLSLFAALLYAVIAAPWASIYQQVTAGGLPPRAED